MRDLAGTHSGEARCQQCFETGVWLKVERGRVELPDAHVWSPI
jgi:hypothetical protein